MKWLETIRIQAAGGLEKKAQCELSDLVENITTVTALEGPEKALLYTHATRPGYFAIRLYWDTPESQPRGSRIALELKQILKALGLTDHAVWIEYEKRHLSEQQGE